jgi:hypothetical protein
VFNALSDSVVGANRDRIQDFTPDTDHIDLSAIDANTTVAGKQAFNFIGNAAFSHHAGELQSILAGANTFVSGDVNGDAKADFQIQLRGQLALTRSDFVLSNSLNVALLGQYTASSLTTTNDGGGGVLTTDPSTHSQIQSFLAQPSHT